MPKRVFIYATCQGEKLYDLLKAVYPDAYEYEFLAFYTVAEGVPIPASLWDADIFIYQPMLNPRGLEDQRANETAHMIEYFRKRDRRCFGFPQLLFDGYHPDYAGDPLNSVTISPTRRWGRFPYGMQGVMNLRGAMSIEALLAETKRDDFIPPDYSQRRAEFSLAALRKAETPCDIHLADWIEANYRSQFLFHTIAHPTNLLLQRLYDPIWEFLGLPAIDWSRMPELLRASSPPVYPSVLKTLNLETAPVAALDFQDVGYDEYITEYAALTADDPVCKATLLWSELPETLPASSTCRVKTCLRNDSSTTWRASAPGARDEVRMSYHWMEGWQYYCFDNVRTRLPKDVNPGESVVIDVEVRAPEEAGTFTLAWDCVIETFCWFSKRGMPLPRSQVRIA